MCSYVFYLHTCYKIVIWPLYIWSIKKGYFRYISLVNPVQVSDKRVCWCNMTWYFARYFQCQCQKHNWSILVPTRLVIILQHIWYVKLLFLFKDFKWSSTFFLKKKAWWSISFLRLIILVWYNSTHSRRLFISFRFNFWMNVVIFRLFESPWKKSSMQRYRNVFKF